MLWLCHLNLSILYDNFPPCLFSLHATNLLEKPGHVRYKLSHVLDLSDCLLQMSLTCPSDPCISHELIDSCLAWWESCSNFRQEHVSSAAGYFLLHHIVVGCHSFSNAKTVPVASDGINLIPPLYFPVVFPLGDCCLDPFSHWGGNFIILILLRLLTEIL